MPDKNQKLMFARIVKVDEAKRTVVGLMTSEAVDNTGEIMDYDTTVPHIKAWSETFQKNTDGKSAGNVRAMHQPIAAGRVTDILFDDKQKAVSIEATVDDDNEWKKVKKGTYTGFSIGGALVGKMWDDPEGKGKRYTAKVSEVSLVDSPCNPEATFTAIKLDGSTELRKYAFASDAAPDASGDDAAAPVVADTPAPAAPEAVIVKGLFADEPFAKAVATALVAKMAAGDMGVMHSMAAVKSLLPLHPEHDATVIKKGMWDVQDLCGVLRSLDWIALNSMYEAKAEGDNSPVPAKLGECVRALCEALRDMVVEETAEIMASYNGGETAKADGLGVTEEEVIAKANTPEGVAALAKAYLALKAAPAPAPESSSSPEGEPAPAPCGHVHKLDGQTDIAKANALIDEATTQLRKLNGQVVDLTKRNAELEDENKKLKALPAVDAKAPKLTIVDKGADLPETLQPEVPVIKNSDGSENKVATALLKVHAAGPKPLS